MEDDMRARMFAHRRSRRPFALATIAAARGGPRPVGAQMIVTAETCAGFLSGGCIEADVALHARAALEDGEPRYLVYGDGSPFIDIRLPCGGRLEVLIESVSPEDEAVSALERLTLARRPALWVSDGHVRACVEAVGRDGPVEPVATRRFDPVQRLVVVGHDPFALAIAAMGATVGWEVSLVRPFGPDAPPPLAVRYHRGSVERAFAEIGLDAWTAVAVATHDLDVDREALIPALLSPAGYVGVLGARRRLPDRLVALRSAGVDERALARLRAPIGLPLGAATAWEVAVSVVGEIVAARRNAELRPAAAA